MDHASDLATLSSLEATGLLVVFVALAALYYGHSAVPVAVLAGTIPRRLVDPTAARLTCGPDCVVCPRCGAENAPSYVYCHQCVGRLHQR